MRIIFHSKLCRIGFICVLICAVGSAILYSDEDEENNEWKGFLPGFSFGVLKPLSDKVYLGINYHYTFTQSITLPETDSDFGGYNEIYLEVGYFKEFSSEFNQDIFFTYAFGINLSFEKFLSGYRSFLIPFLGLKAGGLFINSVGNGFLIEPTLGLVIYYGNISSSTWKSIFF